MKIASLLLTVSLAANGAFVAVLVSGYRADSHSSISSSQLTVHSPPGSSSVAEPKTSGSDTATVAVDDKATLLSLLGSDNFEELKQRFVAAGFPPKEVRALLRQAINDRESAREEAIRGKVENLPYWKSPYPTVKLNAKQRAEMEQGYRETQELTYKYVNGPDSLANDDDAIVQAQRRFGKLPLEKLQQLTAIQHDFERQQFEMFAHQNEDGKTVRPTPKTMHALEEAQLAEVAQLLTPDELEQYELRNSRESNSLRYQLASFRPTEDEFKAIYAIQKQTIPGTASDQMMAQIKAALGPDRFAEYAVTLTSDGRGGLGQLIGRLDLPLTTVTTVNAVRDDIAARAKVVNTDTTLTPIQRQIQLNALASEAQQELIASLGIRGFSAYSDLKGSWLRALRPKHP